MVDPDSDRVPRAPPYSGFCQAASVFAYVAFTLFDRLFQNLSANFRSFTFMQSYNPAYCGLGSSPFARRYSGNLF